METISALQNELNELAILIKQLARVENQLLNENNPSLKKRIEDLTYLKDSKFLFIATTYMDSISLEKKKDLLFNFSNSIYRAELLRIKLEKDIENAIKRQNKSFDIFKDYDDSI